MSDSQSLQNPACFFELLWKIVCIAAGSQGRQEGGGNFPTPGLPTY